MPRTPIQNYLLPSGLIALVCVFIGCGLGALLGDPSKGSGYGLLVGGLAGIGYYFATRDDNPTPTA
jgi:hypothetical protein